MTRSAAFFSPDYTSAKHRFREIAAQAGARLETLPLTATGPNNEELSIDIAWLGSHTPQRALVHSSGLHGVEGFAGSAIQLELLERPPLLRADTAIVLVHVLNPYGMAWLRRVNENNVDLNRNFLARGERWAGAPALYSRLDPLLNPPAPPGAGRFSWRLARLALGHGQRGLDTVI